MKKKVNLKQQLLPLNTKLSSLKYITERIVSEKKNQPTDMLMKSDPIDSSANYIDYYINSNHNHPQEDKFVKTTKTVPVKQFFVPQGNT